jgi:photosystem II stability/assembly factor-like uncharacterized protein
MKHYLFLLALIYFTFGAEISPVYSQSPWVVPQNGLNLSGGTFFSTRLASPQPNILAGSTTYNSGRGVSGSQVFVTTDNGQTWQQQSVAATSNGSPGAGGIVGSYLVDMFVLDGQHMWMLSKDAVTNSRSLLRSTTGLTGLVALPNPLPASFTHIHFFNPSVGLALTSAPLRVFRTTDGGSSWNVLANVTLTGSIIRSAFTTVQGALNTVWVFTDNAMLRTTDAGLTWTAAGTPGGFLTVAFENTLQGLGYTYATSSAGTQELFRTTDGALTWTRVTYNNRPVLSSIAAVPGQPSTYMSVGSTLTVSPFQYVGTTSITRDGGNTWQTLSTDAIEFGQIVACGPSQIWAGTARSNPTPYVSPLLRYTGTTLSTKNSASKALTLFAYPNPSTGIVQLAGPLTGKETVRVYDAAGRLCQQEVVSDAQRTLDLSAQAPGLYLLKLTAPNGTIRTQRLSKLP